MEVNAYGCYTLFRKELLRFTKVGIQTIFSPVVTTLLYLLIFSYAMKGKVETFGSIPYTQFLVPGLIMMSMIQNSFANSSSSLIQSKVNGNIIFILLPPLSPLELFTAYTSASIIRGAAVGIAVFAVSLIFVSPSVFNLVWILVFGLLANAMMGAFGVIAGLWAERYDQMSAFTNFIIVPMSFLSGVFYSVHSLPPLWNSVSHMNPFFYLIDGFRYGFFGQADVSPFFSLLFLLASLLILSVFTVYLLEKGYKIRE